MGNQIQALRWNREIGLRMFLNATTHSVYNFNTGVDFRDELTENGETTTSRFASLYQSGIEDYAGKFDIDFVPNARHLRAYTT